MALVTGGTLAAAVSRAGGLGIVGGGYAGTLGGEPDLDTELSIAKSEKFGVGFITWALSQAPTVLTKALKYSPFSIFLSFGDPSPFTEEIRRAGALLVCQVQCMADIDLALRGGAAAVVVQGSEAGGHAASRSTFPFLPEAADYLKLHSPETLLLAAGGVADGRGLAAALILGADGVVVGTRFWASAEALSKKAHTDKAIAANGDSTVRTKTLDALRGLAWPRQYSFRFLKNKLSNEWANREEQAFQEFGSQAERYAHARVQDDLDTVAVVCGEAIGIIHERPSAESIVTSMAEQAENILRSGVERWLSS